MFTFQTILFPQIMKICGEYCLVDDGIEITDATVTSFFPLSSAENNRLFFSIHRLERELEIITDTKVTDK